MLLGLLASLLSTIVLDRIVVSGGDNVQIMVFSEKSDIIKQKIINSDAGITILYGETGFLRQKREVILTIVHARRIKVIQNIVQEADPEAFMTISSVRDVKGRGFTLEQVDLPMPLSGH